MYVYIHKYISGSSTSANLRDSTYVYKGTAEGRPFVVGLARCNGCKYGYTDVPCMYYVLCMCVALRLESLSSSEKIHDSCTDMHAWPVEKFEFFFSFFLAVFAVDTGRLGELEIAFI